MIARSFFDAITKPISASGSGRSARLLLRAAQRLLTPRRAAYHGPAMKTGRLLKFHRPGGDVHAYLYLEGEAARAVVYLLAPGHEHAPVHEIRAASADEVERRSAPGSTSTTRGLPEMIPTRADAEAVLFEFTQSDALRKHARGVEEAMRAYARWFGVADPAEIEKWGIVGLLHDFDYEQNPTEDTHLHVGCRVLRERGWPGGDRRGDRLPRRLHGRPARHPAQEGALRVRRARRLHRGVRQGAARRRRWPTCPSTRCTKKLKDKAFARSVDRACVYGGAEGLGRPLEEHVAFVIEALVPDRRRDRALAGGRIMAAMASLVQDVWLGWEPRLRALRLAPWEEPARARCSSTSTRARRSTTARSGRCWRRSRDASRSWPGSRAGRGRAPAASAPRCSRTRAGWPPSPGPAGAPFRSWSAASASAGGWPWPSRTSPGVRGAFALAPSLAGAGPEPSSPLRAALAAAFARPPLAVPTLLVEGRERPAAEAEAVLAWLAREPQASRLVAGGDDDAVLAPPWPAAVAAWALAVGAAGGRPE